jgi:hypothetical protein
VEVSVEERLKNSLVPVYQKKAFLAFVWKQEKKNQESVVEAEVLYLIYTISIFTLSL